nr:MAG TPA: hypothetical protein [Caudoviricetes sp.]
MTEKSVVCGSFFIAAKLKAGHPMSECFRFVSYKNKARTADVVQIKNIPMPEVVDLKAAGYIKSQIHGIAVD